MERKHTSAGSRSVLPAPPKDVVRALAALSGNNDFATVCEYLDECLLLQDTENRMATQDVPLRQGQGISQTLDSFLQLAYTAIELYRKMRNSNP